MKQLVSALILLGFFDTQAQKVFTESEFVSVVRKFHPVAKQASLNIRIAKWNVTSSRADFDPQWSFSSAQKQFDGITYYDQTVSEIKIPTWYGVNLHAGTENINGSRINPEETKGQLSYFGVSMPVLQNLVIDKRRAALLKARNLLNLSKVEQESVANDLLRDALESYWTWWEQYHLYKVIEKGLNNAEKRLNLIKAAYNLGDRPLIDTLEAFTQVQSFQIMLADVLADYTKSRIDLHSYLWTDNNEQAKLPDGVVPQSLQGQQVITLDEIVSLAINHPELRQYDFKLKELHIDRRLKFQQLLPDVNVRYNQLGTNFSTAAKQPFFQNNYTYGFSVNIPLRLSEGRGEFAKAKLKIEAAKLQQAYKRVQIDTKVKQYYTEWQQMENQVLLQVSLAKNTQALQRAEEVRFANGESSLFMVNARESKTIEMQKKLIALKAKNKVAHLKLLWSAGLLFRQS